MAEQINFKLISPEKVLIEEPVFQISIPGEEGTFGVRKNHASVISTIRPGVVEILASEGDTPKKIFISGGIADVSENDCLVLAEEADNIEELNQADLEQQLANLKEDLTLVEGESDKNRVEHDIILTRARIEAVTGYVAA